MLDRRAAVVEAVGWGPLALSYLRREICGRKKCGVNHDNTNATS